MSEFYPIDAAVRMLTLMYPDMAVAVFVQRPTGPDVGRWEVGGTGFKDEILLSIKATVDEMVAKMSVPAHRTMQ